MAYRYIYIRTLQIVNMNAKLHSTIKKPIILSLFIFGSSWTGLPSDQITLCFVQKICVISCIIGHSLTPQELNRHS